MERLVFPTCVSPMMTIFTVNKPISPYFILYDVNQYHKMELMQGYTNVVS